ncbi:MAG: hypothetical protein HYU52_11595 [Acidobacteria bacterium]|nr:hypothetical protein [Acidobacteriota bacterium]
MKRIALALAFVLVAFGAQAQLRVSDVLLTDDGTLFTIERVTKSDLEAESGAPVETTSSSVLRLRVQREESLETILVPGSLNGGSHIEPTLAWDSNDNRLYVFWQRMPGIGSSELLFASFKDGNWTAVEAFDGGNWRTRFNLKVTITRFAEHRLEDGTVESRPALIAHAIWWEQWGEHEAARYAMLELEQGSVRRVQIRDLAEFHDRYSPPTELPAGYDKSVFRTPFLFDMPDGDSIEVLFANWYTNRYQLVNIRPVTDEKEGVLTIPTGVTRGEFDPSPIKVPDTNAALKAIRPNVISGTITIYAHNGETVNYAELCRGRWATSGSLKINGATTLETALEALRKRASQR